MAYPVRVLVILVFKPSNLHFFFYNFYFKPKPNHMQKASAYKIRRIPIKLDIYIVQYLILIEFRGN